MERRGVYRKGSAGHVRNVSRYFMSRQKFKQWRFPLTAFLALVIVFGGAPVVGENFQASLLTTDETATLLAENPEQAKKVLLSALSDFLKDCERFKMTACAEHGKTLLKDTAAAGENLPQVFAALQNFEDQYEPEVAKNACKYDLGKLSIAAKDSSKAVEGFFATYGEALAATGVELGGQNLASSVEALSQVVEACRSR